VTMAEETEDLVDITSVVEGCASSLTLSNSILCNEESFDLHDSMAALELMDRKMDCCEIPASTIAHAALYEGATDYMVPPRPFPMAVDDEIAPLPWDDLSLHDACLIVVEALTRLESMLTGASVAESIYTCLYVHNSVLADMKSRLQDVKQASSPAQHAVYATSLAMVAISKVVREIVLNADIYEEEDFSIHTYDLEFFDGVTFDQTMEAMEYGMEYIGNAEEEDARTIRLVLGFELNLLKACLSMVSV
jgi:Mak10 subunit, NatC N(alpha)-terminal acetyltransferase